MISKLESKVVKRFKACQGKFGSHRLNVTPCKHLRSELSNYQLRIAIGLRLVSKDCEKQKRRGSCCLKKARKFSLISILNALKEQNFAPTHFPSILESRLLHRTDQKRPDGFSCVPGAVGRLARSVCNSGTAASELEDRKTDKYRDLSID